MGLDIMELVMEVEDEFCIAIPDEVAQRVRTVGDIYDYVLEQKSRPIDPLNMMPAIGSPDEVWQKLQALFVNQLGVSPEQVTPEADIVKDLGRE
ncbi:MAG: hypothetical protein K8T25_16145 [Planctomycetia bacterium]|nr:hypothetical protein [Planctomycetia bacterium]